MRAICLLLVAFLGAARAQPAPTSMVSYEEKYLQGIKAYSQSKWKDCIVHMRQAMDEYLRLENARQTCYVKCGKEKPKIPLDYFSEEELSFFHGVIQRATCIRKCEEDLAGLQPTGGIPQSIQKDFQKREGYNYLQMSLYQDGEVREAAKACASFGYHNPRNMHIKANLKFYSGQPLVTEEDQKPLESKLYRDLFEAGHVMFYKEDWEEMVQTLELSLKEFYMALDDCKDMCNGSPLRYNPVVVGFSQLMSQQFMGMMECRLNCVQKLGDFRYNSGEDFFGSYFHYLQQGYYFLNRSLDALQASATQVRLEPDSEAAKRNAVFYKQRPGVTGKDFLPREDVMPVIKKQELEHSFVHIVDEVSGHLIEIMEAEERGATNEDEGTDEILLEDDFKRFPVGATPKHVMNEETEPIVTQFGEELKGDERVVVDQLISRQQCERLIELATFATEGDGYQRKSPHTQNEKFEGLHILDAAKRGVAGEYDRDLSWLYVNASHRVKEMVSQQFKLEKPLYFSYTHLVCRTAKEGMQENRKDLSHPAHSDNCILDEASGDCNKVPPAYTWRDYSAILYLNNEFEGGEFFFAHSTKDLSPEVLVNPKCGRMVGFSAGKENMHGVLGVTGGKRCAVALWFTLDPAHREASFDVAENILSGKVAA